MRGAVESADLIVTATPARAPLIEAAWLDPASTSRRWAAISRTSRSWRPTCSLAPISSFADHPPQAATQGEVHHALAAGAIRLEDVVPLGAVAAGVHPGRTGHDQITIADLTGLGIQDAALANAVVALAAARGAGRTDRDMKGKRPGWPADEIRIIRIIRIRFVELSRKFDPRHSVPAMLSVRREDGIGPWPGTLALGLAGDWPSHQGASWRRPPRPRRRLVYGSTAIVARQRSEWASKV